MQSFEATSPLLPEILALHGKWRADQEAVSCDGQSLNWQQFVAMNHRFANGLIGQGIKPGDTVAVVMSNGIPMLQTLMGIMAMGAVSVPINLSVNDDGLISMLSDAEVTALVATSDQLHRIDSLREHLPGSIRLLVTEQDQHPGWLSIEELTSSSSDQAPAVSIADDDRLNIIYSSGTTGMPKGIVHTQAGRRDWAYDLAIALRYHGSSKTVLTIGLYSNISWVAMLTTLLAGGSVVICKKFDAAEFPGLVDELQITHTAMVPIQFQRVIEFLESADRDYDLASMQAMMSCGSPLHSELKQKIFQYFPCGIIELYGLTEGVITTIDPEQSEGRWSSVGRPLLGTDIRIIDDNDQPLPPGQSGEIVSRGRITMPGYLNRPDANRDASYLDETGRTWLRTGDIGYVDEEGFLYIVDRKKDMILSGGQNIYPQDIEAVMVEHNAVNDVAVIAAPSARWGETPIALVVPDKQHQVEAEEIKFWSNQKLGKQQRVADVIFIDELPRNPNGKILKRELRKTCVQRSYD